MRFLLYIIIIQFGCASGSLAQNLSPTLLEDNYTSYFQHSREDVYLHTNKSVFLKGETLFFAAYIQDRNSSRPSLETNTLYCFLYDHEETLLDVKTLFVQNGLAHGDFEIKKNYSNGKIILKAYTNYMRNFEDSEVFIKQLEVTDKLLETEQSQEATQPMEIVILPEGGNAVSGVMSSYGFKVSLANKHRLSTARLVDQMGTVILDGIKFSKDGLGRFQFLPKENNHYNLVFTLDGRMEIIKELPAIKRAGISVSVNNLISDKLIVNIATNDSYYQRAKDEELYMAIHRDGRLLLSKIVLDEPTVNLTIDKKELLTGINVLTFFDKSLQPFAERMIYHQNPTSDRIVLLDSLKITQVDKGTSLHILMNNAKSVANLSVSILPKGSWANNIQNQQSIIHKFVLDPYASSSDYINLSTLKDSRKSMYLLDTFLVIEGWSRYDWDQIFGDKAQLNYNRKSGVDLHGIVVNSTFGEEGNIVFYDRDYSDFLSGKINRNKQFALDQTNVTKGDSLLAMAFDLNGKAFKPDLTIEFSSIHIADDFGGFNNSSISSSASSIARFSGEPIEFEEGFGLSDMNYLDEVTIVADKEKSPTRNRSLSGGVWEGSKITVEEVKKFQTLSSYVRTLGFKVVTEISDGSMRIIPKIPMRQPPIVVLNGWTLSTNDILTDFQLDTVDEIYYEHTGTHGSNGGTIYIYRKEGSFIGQEKTKNFAMILAKEGYDKPNEFYNPSYRDYNNLTTYSLAAIHWEPNIVIGESGEASFLFNRRSLKDFDIYVEGMTTDGQLVSEVHHLDYKPEK